MRRQKQKAGVTPVIAAGLPPDNCGGRRRRGTRPPDFHMVHVMVEGWDPRKTDAIVRVCQRRWRKMWHRHQMSGIDTDCVTCQRTLSIFALLDMSAGISDDFFDRLACAVWRANGGFCHIDVLAQRRVLAGDGFMVFGEEMYEVLRASRLGEQ